MDRQQQSSSMPAPTPLINLHGFEAAAADVLPRMVYDYYAGGANDEVLLGAARTAWNDVALRYRVLRDVSERSLRTTVLGHTVDWPVFVAPMAFQQLAHADGEVATAPAAKPGAVAPALLPQPAFVPDGPLSPITARRSPGARSRVTPCSTQGASRP